MSWKFISIVLLPTHFLTCHLCSAFRTRLGSAKKINDLLIAKSNAFLTVFILFLPLEQGCFPPPVWKSLLLWTCVTIISVYFYLPAVSIAVFSLAILWKTDSCPQTAPSLPFLYLIYYKRIHENSTMFKQNVEIPIPNPISQKNFFVNDLGCIFLELKNLTINPLKLTINARILCIDNFKQYRMIRN